MKRADHRFFYRRAAALSGFGLSLLLGLFGTFGCRAVPFYPMTPRQSQALTQSREGIAAFERGEYEEAEKRLDQAIKGDENDLNARRYYAETLWARGKKDEAFQTLVQVAREHGTPDEAAEVNRSLAEKLLHEGQPVSALNFAEKVIELAPNRADGWALRGNVFWQLGKTEDALADYHKALHYAPDDRDLLWQMAILENQAGLYDRSLATWQRLGRLYPGNREPAEILCGKAFACRKMKRYQESSEFYTLAIEQKPERVEYYALLADVYLENNDTVAAAEVVTRVNSLFPASGETRELNRRMEQLRLAADRGASPY